MERWQAKVLALFGTFILPLFATMLPYKLSDYVAKKGKVGELVLAYLMCFGGGIFFGTYLLHMGPDVRVLLDNALLIPYDIQYPVAELFVGVGFFFVLFSEKFVLKWNERRLEKKARETATMVKLNRVGESLAMQNGNCDLVKPCWKLPVLEVVVEDDEGKCCDNEAGSKDKEEQVQLMEHQVSRQTGNDNATALRNGSHSVQTEENSSSHQQQHNHHHGTRSIILILALSMHRIFEGMTIGLQGNIHNVWSLFLAVMCHEVVIGFSLGLQLVKSEISLRRMTITTFICSCIMPVGMAIGIVLTELGRAEGSLSLANGILQAIAMGTFIYVTFFEILQEEIDPNDTSIGKIVFIFAGFMMMAALDLIPEEDGTLTTEIAEESLFTSLSTVTNQTPFSQ